MKQEIYQDHRSIDVWDNENSARCFIHVMNSDEYHSVTDSFPPSLPPSAEDYNLAGLPWFDYYSDHPSIDGADVFKDLKSVGAKTIEELGGPLDGSQSLVEKNINKIREARPVREWVI